MSHTPGPWKHHGDAVWSEHESVSGKVTKGERTNHVCAVSSRLRMPERERLANARLIVSAPDLLAALQATKSWMEDCMFDMQQVGLPSRTAYVAVCEAIAKATGSEPAHGE